MKNFTDSQSCSDIATQLIRGQTGQNFNVIYGGGRKKFISEKIISDEDGQSGQRIDGLNLIDEWLMTKNSSKSTYIYNRQGLVNMNHSKIEHVRVLSRILLEFLEYHVLLFSQVLGLFNVDHLSYHLDNEDSSEPTLREMTISAIEIMRKNPKGFVLFVEGGRIGWF
jgi:alkaline phosphatase